MKRLLLLKCTLLVLVCTGCADKNVEIDPKKPVDIQIDNYVPTRTEVRSAVVAASHSLGWRAMDRAPGLVHVVYKIRGRETLTLEVDFSETEYIIRYAGSSRKAYALETGKIHPYFESNSEKLRIAIEKQLPKIAEPDPEIVVKPSVSIDFANTAVIEKEQREAAEERAEEEAENATKRAEDDKAVQQARVEENPESINKNVDILDNENQDESKIATQQKNVPNEPSVNVRDLTSPASDFDKGKEVLMPADDAPKRPKPMVKKEEKRDDREVPKSSGSKTEKPISTKESMELKESKEGPKPSVEEMKKDSPKDVPDAPKTEENEPKNVKEEVKKSTFFPSI